MNEQQAQIPEWVRAEVGRLHLQNKLTEARIAGLTQQVAQLQAQAAQLQQERAEAYEADRLERLAEAEH